MARIFNDLPAATAATSSPPPPLPLPSPLPDLGVALSAADLRATAYEVLVAASRATGAKPLTYIPQAAASSSAASTTVSWSQPFLQRSAAAGKAKGTLGPGLSSGRRAAGWRTIEEHVRVRLGVTEQADARIRRGLLRIAAGQLGKPAKSMVLPLEFLQKFKDSDFSNALEYETWQTRNFKLLEAGLLVHPLVPLKKSDVSAQRLRKIIQEGYDGRLETGWNSECMQTLRSAVMSLACRSLTETSDGCHWVDGFPLNLHIYKMLVEACFDGEDGAIVDEIDEVIELLKMTWAILGVNQMLHNLCITWALFSHFVMSGQSENELLSATANLLVQVTKDAEITEDPDYCDVLSSTLGLIKGWTEKRMLAYHEAFSSSNTDSMQDMVSIGISTAKIYEHHRGTKENTDVVHSRIATYIQSSLRTAFVQKMEEADTKRSSWNPVHVLSILAKEVGDLAAKEKTLYSSILKKWHPRATCIAVATLHDCFGNELKQFIAGLKELTPDAGQVLKAADKLEKDLVHIAIEDSMDSNDGGKTLVREMPPYEAGFVLDNLVKSWIKERVNKLKRWTDQNIQQETWNQKAHNRDSVSASSVEMLRIINENLDAFFQLPILLHSTVLPDLKTGCDTCLQLYISKVKSGCGTPDTLFPKLPHLTRCNVRSKLFKNKEKTQSFVKRGSQVGSATGNEALSLPGLCVRINTLHYIQIELENLDRKMETCLKNVSAPPDTTYGLNINFQISQSACQEGIRQLCETTAYKVIFNDLSHVLLDTLYVGSPASNRILPLLKELGPILKFVSATVHDRLRKHLITALMKASFDGFLLVLLAGGPARAFSCQDYKIIEDDFRALRGLYLTNGHGIPEEIVVKASSEIKNILPLLQTDTETLIRQFKQIIFESCGSIDKSRFPMPPVPAQWSRNNPNTILRVLCYRNDEAASKFLKQTYDLPKTL